MRAHVNGNGLWRERRSVSEKPYKILFELVKEDVQIANGQPPAASTTHRSLGSNSSNVYILSPSLELFRSSLAL